MDEFRDTTPTGCADWDACAPDPSLWDDFVGDGSGWDESGRDESVWQESGQDDGTGALGSAYKALSDRIDDALDELIRLDIRRAQLAAEEMALMVRIAGEAERRREVIVLDQATDAERLLTIADEAREEVAAALRRPTSTVHDQLVAARLLFGPLRRTLDALAGGRITEAHAREIARHAEVLHRSLSADDTAFAAACTALEDLVLVRAESCTRAQLRRLATAAVAAIDAMGEQDRRRDARAAIDVRVQADDYGLSVLTACLETADAERIRAMLEVHAASSALVTPCDATLGQRRAAALLDLVCGSAPDDERCDRADAGACSDEHDRAGGHGRAVVGAEISLVITLDELMRGDGVVGALLDDPELPLSLRRLITDPQTGQALDLGRSRYEVSEPLRRWIIARDRTCRFPGCSRRASTCQIDHVVAWTDDGGTDAANLHCLCTRHHQLKTHGDWQVSREDATGLTVWTSPAGRTYWVDPEPAVPPEPPPFAPPPPAPPPPAPPTVPAKAHVRLHPQLAEPSLPF